jgi:hypothetical protein
MFSLSQACFSKKAIHGSVSFLFSKNKTATFCLEQEEVLVLAAIPAAARVQ